MKPSERKRLYADVAEAQDMFRLDVVAVGSQYKLSVIPRTHLLTAGPKRMDGDNIRAAKKAMMEDMAAAQAMTFMESKGWKTTEITSKGDETRSFLVGSK